MSSLLIAYDGSENAKLAITRAAELMPGASAAVVHVWEPLANVASVPPVPGLEGLLKQGLDEMDSIGDEVSRKVAEEGAELARSAGLDCEGIPVRAEGRAWRTLLDLARERNVDAIVAGRRGVSRVEAVILGSVSGALVQHADRPVLLVPGG